MMIVRRFLQWVRMAPPGDRAEATSALARAYLYSDLSAEERAAAEGAMILLLDDPSPLVRKTLAEVFAGNESAPPVVVHALAHDQPDIAAIVLARSPLLLDAELVDMAATAAPQAQAAIAARQQLPSSVAAAIAEVGVPEACLTLMENPFAVIPPFSLDRIAARHGHLAPIREHMLERNDLSVPTRQALLACLSSTLAGYASGRYGMDAQRIACAAKEACEKATVALAAETPFDQVGTLIRHLRESGQLTAGLLLRALLSGNVVLFEEALAELSGLPAERVESYIHDKHISGFHALYRRAGLPDAAYPGFSEAIAALREGVLNGETSGAERLKRRMIERVLTRCADDQTTDIEPLLTLLRRYATEAAREEARAFCQQLAGEAYFDIGVDERLVA